MTTPLDGYAVIEGRWYEVGPVQDMGTGLLVAMDEIDPETLAEVMSGWEERVVDMIREVAPGPSPEDIETLVSDITATLWEHP